MKMSLMIMGMLISLTGCTFHPVIERATYELSSTDAAELSVDMKQKDAEIIKKNEYYFSLVVINCDMRGPEEYPSQVYVGKYTAASFDWPLSSPTVKFTGWVPLQIMKEYRQPCVFVRGGGIFSGQIQSDLKPLTPAA